MRLINNNNISFFFGFLWKILIMLIVNKKGVRNKIRQIKWNKITKIKMQTQGGFGPELGVCLALLWPIFLQATLTSLLAYAQGWLLLRVFSQSGPFDASQ